MADAVIDNPILNSPFDEPERHWKFERDGITNEIVDGRRVSSYFVPVPKSQRGGDQLQFETEWTSGRIEENRTINRIRERVGLWRRGGWQGVTSTTRRLLEYWTDPSISQARTPTLMLSRASGQSPSQALAQAMHRRPSGTPCAARRLWITSVGSLRVSVRAASIVGEEEPTPPASLCFDTSAGAYYNGLHRIAG